jgi:DNA-binding transcriptional MerR regulator/methylmalonyl-CoA mutase cobalamin-binding subunit
MQGHFPIGSVAKITGISIDKLRAWERRYKAVVPERSDRGRVYGPAQIDRLTLLTQLVHRGHTISAIASLTDNQLRNLLAKQPAPAAPAVSTSLLDPVLSAIDDFDSLRAGDELSRLASLLAPRDVVYQVALPLMNEVGVRWSKGLLGIAQEHLISQMMRNLLGSMMRLFRSSNAAPKMVLATPGGEMHEFGILAAAMLASMAGIQPVYLGPTVPPGEIAEAAKRTYSKVVVLGLTIPTPTTGEELRSIAANLPEDAELWVGGGCITTLDISPTDRKILVLEDLPAFEIACRRWSN